LQYFNRRGPRIARRRRGQLSGDQFQLREQMAEFFFLGFQISDVSRMRRDLDRHA
jgi:hypothetical protein